MNDAPVDGEAAYRRGVVSVNARHGGNCRSSARIRGDEIVHRREHRSRWKRFSKYFGYQLVRRADFARSSDNRSDHKLARRFIGEIEESRLRRDVEQRFSFRRIHDAFRPGTAAAANRNQRAEKKDLVSAHGANGCEHFFWRGINMNDVPLLELPD